MKSEKTSLLSNGLIWFGAAVSIAEILTGTLLAPLGFTKGIIAIFLGHIIGCALMYLAGLIGAKTEKTAMDTVKTSFGHSGALFFTVLNVLQLIGWTAVMIIGGAHATAVIANPVLNIGENGVFGGNTLWCIVIGSLILIWLLAGLKTLNKINLVAMGALFLLTIMLSVAVLRGNASTVSSENMTFGMAVELSAAMPLSWLPLISDYTQAAKRPKAATGVSTIVYFFTSCWMYIIGLGAAIFTGESDIAQIMVKAGLGIAGIFIIIFSTVTTTFLDAYSAGISFNTITSKVSGKWIAVIVCVAGTFLAIMTPIEQYQNFLYLIGSVFAPMIAILITDFFILRKDHTRESVNITNLILWAGGFAIYRWFMTIDTVVGSTLPVMIIICILAVIINGGFRYVRKNS